jgi:hypothetical protein
MTVYEYWKQVENINRRVGQRSTSELGKEMAFTEAQRISEALDSMPIEDAQAKVIDRSTAPWN